MMVLSYYKGATIFLALRKGRAVRFFKNTIPSVMTNWSLHLFLPILAHTEEDGAPQGGMRILLKTRGTKRQEQAEPREWWLQLMNAAIVGATRSVWMCIKYSLHSALAIACLILQAWLS